MECTGRGGREAIAMQDEFTRSFDTRPNMPEEEEEEERGIVRERERGG